MASIGAISYAGIYADGPCSYTLASGINPGILTANYVLRYSLPTFGPMLIEYNGQSLYIPYCHLKSHTITPGGNGGRWRTVIIEDSRWRWRYGNCYGDYNTYIKGSKLPKSKKTLSEICDILLQEMNESCSTSMLPEAYPTVSFDGRPPAQILYSLLGEYGFDIAIGNGATPYIFEKNIGQGLSGSDTRMMDYTVSAEPPIIPRKRYIEAFDTRWQEDIPLEAVGREINTSEYKPIDDLSYTPANGWENENPPEFSNVTGESERELAKAEIFNVFRIKGPFKVKDIMVADAPGDLWTIKEGEEWRVLPLNSTQLSLYPAKDEDGPNNPIELKTAQVFGYFAHDRASHRNNVEQDIYDEDVEDIVHPEGSELEETYSELMYRGSVSIDWNTGIVRLGKKCWYIKRESSDGIPNDILPPKLWLRTSFPVRHTENHSTIRMQYEHSDSNGVDGVKKLIQPDQLIYEIGRTKTTPQSEFQAAALFYVRQDIDNQNSGPSYTIPYKRFIFDRQIDGLNRSITYSKSPGGCISILEWGIESNIRKQSYKEKKRENEVIEAVRAAKKATRDQVGKGKARSEPVQ